MPQRAHGIAAAACVLGTMVGTVAVAGSPAGPPPRELGAVSWGGDLDAARRQSAADGRPVLLLFQEVPGCATCVDFGREVLAHPLIVEAIETEFVPVAVRNNVGGEEGRIRESFREPACNFPVVRFLSADGTELLPRRDRIWSAGGVVERMTAALQAAGRPVPAYLSLLGSEMAADRLRTAVFAMSCYWEGEARLGAMDGVVSTRAGWLDGSEAVEVRFDPAIVGEEDLARHAESAGCRTAPAGASARDAKDSDRKVYLARSELRHLPLTPAQAAKVNAALRFGDRPAPWLSPRQLRLADALRAALSADPHALDGLEAPDDADALPAYDRALRERLALP